MSTILLLVPDFALILFGLALKRWFESSENFWGGVERLIYYVLFPALLFTATARAHIDPGTAIPMLIAGIGATVAGMLLGALAKPLFHPTPAAFAGGFQCAFRFNTYIGLAIIARLHGDAGLASMTLLLGIAIPLVNVVAVWSLSHRAQNIVEELGKNPLIIATVGGIVFNVLGFDLPDTGWQILGRLGGTSLALALLAVGAALKPATVSGQGSLIAWWLGIKLLAVPACAYVIALALDLDALSLHCAVLFAALPAATSAYILAVRMNGDGRIAAAVISSSTLGAMLTLPLWLALMGAVHP